MQHSKVLKGILLISGLLISIPGAFALFSPEGFTARNGVDISGDFSLLNDYRGTGGLMLGCGITILLGVLHTRMAFTSTVVAILGFLGIGIGRILSIGLDGMPADGLVKATVVEVVIGLVAIFALVRYREKSTA